MTASALTIPEPLPDDPDAVTTALETAAIFGTQGDAREAVRWVRRAAEAAGDEGNDLRALTLARLAADLTSQIGGDSVAPATATNGSSAAPTPASVAALDTALGVVPSAPADPLATTAPELGLAPTVAATPRAGGGEPVAANNVVETPAPPAPDSEEANGAGAPAAWSPPAPPPPVVAGAAGAEEQPALAAESASGSDDGAPPPAGSLRAALQRFSQHAPSSSAASAASQSAQPDLQQSPALAALVQSIARSQPAPAAASPAAVRAQGGLARAQAPLASPAASRADSAELAQPAIAPVAELERTPPGGLTPPSDVADAITDPRYVPSVAAKDAEPARAEDARAVSETTRSVQGARRAVRASVDKTTEPGVFVLQLLEDGESATGHEAMVVLVDPRSDLFE